MRLLVGPVASASARMWTSHMLHNLGVVAANVDELPFRFPDDVIVAFRELLEEWHEVATASEVFVWVADMDPAVVRHLTRYWANLDSLTDTHLERLGVTWSPPAARPFFAALATAVATALERDEAGDPFANLLLART